MNTKTDEGKRMEGNLTKGPILKTLTKLAIPIMASSFLGTLYNITDMAWIGLLGSKAVAGVGVGGMFTWLSQGLAAMARMGGQVQVAQCIGRDERDRAHGFAQAAVQLATLMGMAYAVISLVFTRQMVAFFQLTDPEAQTAALSYTKIACGLIVFSFLTLTMTGLYTAQGDSKTPFLANLIGLVTNMILDPVLILGPGPFPKLGVVGAAIATVTAQAIVMMMMILGVIIQKKENVLKGIRLTAKIPKEYLGGLCRIGIPTAIQGMAYCAISMVLTRMVSAYGAEAVATQRVGGQIESISWNTADGFAAALNAFIAQNYGAGKMDRVRKGYRASLWTVGIWGLLISFVFICFPKAIADIFFHEPKAVATAVGYLVIIGFSEAFMCVELTTVGALSGLGRTRLCSIISIAFTSARIPLAIILGGLIGLSGIWWALSITSIIKGIIFTCTFLWITRKRG
jgi:putative MATE family efflux protein